MTELPDSPASDTTPGKSRGEGLELGAGLHTKNRIARLELFPVIRAKPCPAKKTRCSPNARASDCDLVRKQALNRGNQVKIGSLGRALIQCDRVLIRGETWAQRQLCTREDDIRTQREKVVV